MHRIRPASPAAAVLALALSLGAVPARARDVAHVEVPERTEVAGRTLRLNGAGLRSKFFFEVYVAALYLPEPTRDAASILAADAPWVLSMTFMRDVGRQKILDGFTEAFEHNSPGELDRLRPELARLSDALTDLARGQRLVVRYVPGEGLTFGVAGITSVTVAGRPFAVAMLKTWIGDFPADPSLKEALLGG
jgi:hypothetical protein